MVIFILFQILDVLFFILISFSAIYLLVFAIASKFYREVLPNQNIKQNRILVLFPAYKEDAVIEISVANFLLQDYQKELYEVVVISDHLEDETNDRLSKMPITLLKVNFTNSSKAKALNFAIDHFKTEPFDIVIILDADNITETNFLKNISNAYSSGAKAIQVHRTAKNLQTDVAVFDAITEEFNNSIFRKGHYALGLSSALIGSGMAFDFEWFSNNVNHLCTVGEDKELESLLLMQSVRIHYLNSVYVYDEKISKNEVYYSQRQRWLTAQYGSLKSNLRNIPVALRERNIDYLDKIFQWMLLPRIVLFGFSILISVLLLLIAPDFSVKWICLTLLELLVFALCIPQALFRKFIKVGWKTVPILFIMMFMNLFRIKRSKSFIHTPHGEF